MNLMQLLFAVQNLELVYLFHDWFAISPLLLNSNSFQMQLRKRSEKCLLKQKIEKMYVSSQNYNIAKSQKLMDLIEFGSFKFCALILHVFSLCKFRSSDCVTNFSNHFQLYHLHRPLESIVIYAFSALTFDWHFCVCSLIHLTYCLQSFPCCCHYTSDHHLMYFA